MIRFTQIPSPVDDLLLAADEDKLIGVWFAPHTPGAGWLRDDAAPVLQQARRELDEYFTGRRTRFDIALDPRGTPFQRGVWQALLSIGFGRTSTYGALAATVGSPRGARAVGAAVGANPISIIVPCHRIVGSTGALTGFGGGLPRKERLLALEGALLPLARPAAADAAGAPHARA
jgi:methylated-DNA-[protein]-cysteine S-methyltransferase